MLALDAMHPSEILRHRRYVASLAARLRGVCAALSEPEFAQLVADIAATSLRLEALELRPDGERAYDPGSPLPLAELSRESTLSGVAARRD